MGEAVINQHLPIFRTRPLLNNISSHSNQHHEFEFFYVFAICCQCFDTQQLRILMMHDISAKLIMVTP